MAQEAKGHEPINFARQKVKAQSHTGPQNNFQGLAEVSFLTPLC